MAESEKARKKRLAKQSKAAKADRKPATTEKQKETAVKKEESRTEVIRKGIEVKKSKPRKKAAAPRRPRGPIIGTAPDTAPKTGPDYRDDNKVKNAAFEDLQKERAESEVGGVAALGEEASAAEKQARSEQLAKYQEQIKEVSTSAVPKNEGTVENDPLRPKQEEKFVPPTPAEAARESSRPARGGSGTGVYTFDAAEGAPQRKETDVAELRASREAKGLPGLPGDENKVNALALELSKRDYGIAKETGKVVNEMDPTGDEPTTIDQIYNGHHRRLADVMIHSGLTENQIRNSAQGSGAGFQTKVKMMHNLLKQNRSERNASPIDLEKEGITHWVHPTTGVAHAISENHPDMPKVQPEGVAGGEGVKHGFWRAGISKRVRKDQNTGRWVTDQKTGRPEIDATLGWDPDKAVGFNVVTLRGGVKALKANIPPIGSRSAWEHEVNTLKSEFPASSSEDSRLQHKARATKIVEDATRPMSEGKRIARNKKGEPIPRIKTRTGKVMGLYRKTGRTTPAGFTVNEEGTTTPTIATTTSRGRVIRPDTIGTTGRVYNPGGSTLVTQGKDVPEVTKTVEFTAKKRNRMKTKTQNGKRVLNPPVVGVPGGGGALVQNIHPAFIPVTDHNKGQQFAPQPKWDRPNVIGENEPGVSTAEPITKGSPEIHRVKVSKRSKKTKLVATPGMVDQMIPGFKNVGVNLPSNPLENKDVSPTIVEGPITSAQDFAERTESYNPSSGKYRVTKGRVTSPSRTETVKPTTSPISKQLVKIPGNSPVEQPVEATPKGRRKKSAPERPVTKLAAPEPEQMALPGMERNNTSIHAEGQQWLRNRDLSVETRRLQGSARNIRPTNEEPAEDTRSVAEKFETPTDKIMRGVREKKAEK
jgi:hypothetical protein